MNLFVSGTTIKNKAHEPITEPHGFDGIGYECYFLWIITLRANCNFSYTNLPLYTYDVTDNY